MDDGFTLSSRIIQVRYRVVFSNTLVTSNQPRTQGVSAAHRLGGGGGGRGGGRGRGGERRYGLGTRLASNLFLSLSFLQSVFGAYI